MRISKCIKQANKTGNISEPLPFFYRHETFHPRHGWFKKIYDAVKEDKKIFLREDATVTLGVGKNMVKSMRYWGSAFKLFRDSLDDENKGITLTPFADSIFSDEKGYDPYVEDPATLWLLHWQLLQKPSIAAAWWFFFNGFHRASFSSDEAVDALKKWRETTFPSRAINESSLSKDVNCILRMYLEDDTEDKDDAIGSPFADLKLLQRESETSFYAFNIGKKSTLPAEILVALCLDYIERIQLNASTISVSRLLHDLNSPGLIFKLTEHYLCLAIEQVSKDFDEIMLSESAGLLQFSFSGKLNTLSQKLLKHYYRR